MKKFLTKAFPHVMGVLFGITTVLIIIIVFPMVANGLGKSVTHLKNQLFVYSNGGNQISSGEFLSNRNFNELPRVVTSLNKTTLLHETEIDFCGVAIEGLYGASCFAEKAEVYGPFGVVLNFDRGRSANDFPDIMWENVVDCSADYLRIYSVNNSAGKKQYHSIDFSQSHIYFELKNKDGSHTLISQITGETWLQLAQNGWIATFKESDGSLMMTSGHYRLVLVMNHKFFCDDGSIEIMSSKNTVHVYDMFVNNDLFHRGILQKKGAQDDYKFQLNFCDNGFSLIYPESQKLTVVKDQLFGVFCSEKDPAQNAKITLYYFDDHKNTYIKIDEKVLFDSNSSEQKELLSLDFGDYGSGMYKIILEGDFSDGLLKTKRVTEEYEYYYSMGALS